jgi:hypothetical protein
MIQAGITMVGEAMHILHVVGASPNFRKVRPSCLLSGDGYASESIVQALPEYFAFRELILEGHPIADE